MKDKLVFKPKEDKKPSRQTNVRITEETFVEIESISAKTGLSMSYIASRMIAFALERTDVVEYEDE